MHQNNFMPGDQVSYLGRTRFYTNEGKPMAFRDKDGVPKLGEVKAHVNGEPGLIVTEFDGESFTMRAGNLQK